MSRYKPRYERPPKRTGRIMRLLGLALGALFVTEGVAATSAQNFFDTAVHDRFNKATLPEDVYEQHQAQAAADKRAQAEAASRTIRMQNASSNQEDTWYTIKLASMATGKWVKTAATSDVALATSVALAPALVGMMLVGYANRRNRRPDGDYVDVETLPNHHKYGFEIRGEQQQYDHDRYFRPLMGVVEGGLDLIELRLKEAEARLDDIGQAVAPFRIPPSVTGNLALNAKRPNSLGGGLYQSMHAQFAQRSDDSPSAPLSPIVHMMRLPTAPLPIAA